MSAAPSARSSSSGRCANRISSRAMASFSRPQCRHSSATRASASGCSSRIGSSASRLRGNCINTLASISSSEMPSAGALTAPQHCLNLCPEPHRHGALRSGRGCLRGRKRFSGIGVAFQISSATMVAMCSRNSGVRAASGIVVVFSKVPSMPTMRARKSAKEMPPRIWRAEEEQSRSTASCQRSSWSEAIMVVGRMRRNQRDRTMTRQRLAQAARQAGVAPHGGI